MVFWDSFVDFRFLSTPSARRATLRQAFQVQKYYISIHALREEGDQSGRASETTANRFLSTPSARRATSRFLRTRQCTGISIHALREEGDAFGYQEAWAEYHFYPRPPRGGRRVYNQISNNAAIFLSTPSARRATPYLPHLMQEIQDISIHALREEGDDTPS